MISACAVGSLLVITALWPRPLISPPMTTTAPTGTSPSSRAASASASACRMNSLWVALMRETPVRKETRMLSGEAEEVKGKFEFRNSNFEFPIMWHNPIEYSAMIVRTRHGPLYYDLAGEGPPVVFASGWAMSGECWRPAIDLLKRKYRCLLYD